MGKLRGWRGDSQRCLPSVALDRATAFFYGVKTVPSGLLPFMAAFCEGF
jgi:hypothetical protein